MTFFFFFFFNPTIEVVTFRLREWCVLGVFLLPAFTRLGRECQGLSSLWDGMNAIFIYNCSRAQMLAGILARTHKHKT